MTTEEAKDLIPEIDSVIYAGSTYKVAEVKKLITTMVIGIYDEPPSNHIDYVQASNCTKATSRNKEGTTIDYLYNVLKRTLEGDEQVKVEFDNKKDEANFILDVCNSFKRVLIEDGKHNTTMIPKELINQLIDYINRIDIKAYPTREDKQQGRNLRNKLEEYD